MELPDLFRQMARARAFELAVEELWKRGLISGEMHLGTGEEAIAAGVVTHLRDGDGLSLAHRSSGPLVVRGVPLAPMLRELLGREDGLCGGRAGHMHLMSKPHLASSTGIVGGSMPLGVGFALAAKRLRPRAVGVSFVGDGAMNQGMSLEALNLSVAFKLPFLVVCIDNGWAITTASDSVTGGDLAERARVFGLAVERVDGSDVLAVHRSAGALLERARKGKGPGFLHATCPRMDGHFLGDPLLEQAQHPAGAEAKQTIGDVMSAVTTRGGGGVLARAAGVTNMMKIMAKARRVPARGASGDPMYAARRAMKGKAPERIEEEAEHEVRTAVEEVGVGEGHHV